MADAQQFKGELTVLRTCGMSARATLIALARKSVVWMDAGTHVLTQVNNLCLKHGCAFCKPYTCIFKRQFSNKPCLLLVKAHKSSLPCILNFCLPRWPKKV